MPDKMMSPYIGGTTISVILGVNRWKTPRRLFEEWCGTVQPGDLSQVEAVQMGIELEETVARIFTKKTGFAVRRSPKRYVHPDYPYMSCQVDRLVTGQDELLECKTASAWMIKEWEGEEIPVEYILQVQWQLMITGRSVGWIAVLIGGQKFLYKKIEADKELQDKMIQAAITWWDMWEKKIPPVVEGEDNPLMVQLYPRAGADIAEASADMTTAIKLLQQTKAQIKDLESVKDECEAKIKDSIKGLLGIRTPEYTVKWIDIKGSTYTVTKPDSRQLRIIKNKE